jgi:hypothetical protein
MPPVQPTVVQTVLPSGHVPQAGLPHSVSLVHAGPDLFAQATEVPLPQVPFEQCSDPHTVCPSRHTEHAGGGQSASDAHAGHAAGSVKQRPEEQRVLGQSLLPSGHVPQVARAQSASTVQMPPSVFAVPPVPLCVPPSAEPTMVGPHERTSTTQASISAPTQETTAK